MLIPIFLHTNAIWKPLCAFHVWNEKTRSHSTLDLLLPWARFRYTTNENLLGSMIENLTIKTPSPSKSIKKDTSDLNRFYCPFMFLEYLMCVAAVSVNFSIVSCFSSWIKPQKNSISLVGGFFRSLLVYSFGFPRAQVWNPPFCYHISEEHRQTEN